MERDPHQLIEGILIACYAVGLRPGVPLRAGRDGAGPGADRGRAQRGLRGRLRRAQHPRHRLLARRRAHLGCRRLHRGRGDRAHREPRGQPGHAPAQAAVLPGGQGPLPAADDREQRRDAVERAVDRRQRRRAPSRRSAPRRRRAPACSRCRATSRRPGVFEVEYGVTTFRDLIYAPVYGGGIRDDHELKAFIPGGASAPWFYEEHLDLPLEKGTVDKAGSMLGSGAIVVMDETTDMVKACLRVVRFFARESCGKCTPCREGTSWLERILQRILDGYGRPSDLDLLMDVCDNISPGHRLAAEADDDLPARPVGRVADRVGHPALPPRVRGPHRAGRAVTGVGGRARTGRRPMSDTATADDATPASRGRDGHHRRPRHRGRRRASCIIDGGRAQRRLHPPLLLPPAHGARSACAACASSRSTPAAARACSRAACSSARPT